MNRTTKFLFGSLAVAAGLTLTSSLATAQIQQEQQTTVTRTTTTSMSSDPGYSDFGYANDNVAAHNGYHDGYDKGISDHNTGHTFRPTNDHYYTHPIGYVKGTTPMTKDQYEKVYREAFLHGYERGYKKADEK